MGKLTINGNFSIAMLNYQRGCIKQSKTIKVVTSPIFWDRSASFGGNAPEPRLTSNVAKMNLNRDFASYDSYDSFIYKHMLCS